ncbi:hypothetical protein CASFOL_039732 [Castilleja foliolosa]|uniref:F-box domain-containing protein n=1 Tax=Castilleja foliolosa TaxID=1961234 RepID=A0ABD3BGE9_9LAMI
MANSFLPEDLMICILTRLPVKTIIRFKSVCKTWFHLFSTPEFIKLHQAQLSSTPPEDHQSFIVHSFMRFSSDPKTQFSIFNVEDGDKKPTILQHPFAHAGQEDIQLYTVGCCNGLVCIRRAGEFLLWNPATNMSKTVPFKGCRYFKMVSVGFGYDAIKADFKVVMLVSTMEYTLAYVEIYSVNLDSWIKVDAGCFDLFHSFSGKNDLILNGNPYWVARIDGNEVLACFDVLELVFKIVHVPTIHWMSGLVQEAEVVYYGIFNNTHKVTEREIRFVDWNGALGALVTDYEVEYNPMPDVPYSLTVICGWVWVHDDIERIWRYNYAFGPSDMEVSRVSNCIKNQKILGTLSFGKMCVLDLETGYVTELFDRACLGRYSFEAHGYTESLVHINGMEKVVQPNKMIDESIFKDVCFENLKLLVN